MIFKDKLISELSCTIASIRFSNALIGCRRNSFFLFLALIQAIPVANAQDLVSAYQDYTLRAKVSEPMRVASSIKTSITEYFFEHNQFPANLEQLKQAGGLDQVESKYAKTIQVDKGVIRIRLGFKPLENKSFILSPTVN